VTPSWALLLDPEVAGALPGRVALLDDPREALGAALHLLGLDPNTTDEAEIEAAGELVAWSSPGPPPTRASTRSCSSPARSSSPRATTARSSPRSTATTRFAYVVPRRARRSGPTTSRSSPTRRTRAPRTRSSTSCWTRATPRALDGDPLRDAQRRGRGAARPELLADPAIYPSDEVRERLRFLVDTGDVEIRYSDVFERAKR
jgi:hypothetical protein